MYRSAHGGRGCAVAVWCDRRGWRESAAGVTWTNRTLAAPWAARSGHTAVVDAAGAIYVIGGTDGSFFGGGTTDYHDVWASTDGGARAGLSQSGY
jgi:hypothetical protein